MARRRSTGKGKEELERKFAYYVGLLAPTLPPPEREYRFVRWELVGPEPGLRARIKEAGLGDWRIDFAWPRHNGAQLKRKVTVPGGLAIEIEGGIFTGGRHTRALGFHGDTVKYNRAALNGWLLLRFTAVSFDDPAGMIEQVVEGYNRVFGNLTTLTMAA